MQWFQSGTSDRSAARIGIRIAAIYHYLYGRERNQGVRASDTPCHLVGEMNRVRPECKVKLL
jgi:hypothetical protein